MWGSSSTTAALDHSSVALLRRVSLSNLVSVDLVSTRLNGPSVGLCCSKAATVSSVVAPCRRYGDDAVDEDAWRRRPPDAAAIGYGLGLVDEVCWACFGPGPKLFFIP